MPPAQSIDFSWRSTKVSAEISSEKYVNDATLELLIRAFAKYDWVRPSIYVTMLNEFL